MYIDIKCKYKYIYIYHYIPYMDPIGEVIPPKTLLTMAWYKRWSCIALFCFRVISGWYTPWKINMQPTNHPSRKEHDLNQTSIITFHVSLQRCKCRCFRKNITSFLGKLVQFLLIFFTDFGDTSLTPDLFRQKLVVIIGTKLR